MKRPTIEHQLIKAVTELLSTSELNMDDMEPSTRDTIGAAESIRDRAQRQTQRGSRQIDERIKLTGIRPFGYTVITSGWDGCLPIEVPSARAGHAIVRALRQEAAARPDLFPPSQKPPGAKP